MSKLSTRHWEVCSRSCVKQLSVYVVRCVQAEESHRKVNQPHAFRVEHPSAPRKVHNLWLFGCSIKMASG